MAIHVGVVEDDPVTRDLLVGEIESSEQLSVQWTADTLASARAALESQLPDILLVDLQLPDGDGTALIREQSGAHPTLPSLVISVFGDEERVVGAIRAGAQGYLLKDDEGEEIEEAICRVLDGQSPISPAIAVHLIRQFHTPIEPSTQADVLSERELEALELAAKGLTYQETADVMGVSVHTVGTFTKRIYTKLMVHSRAEAIFEARQLGLMSRD